MRTLRLAGIILLLVFSITLMAENFKRDAVKEHTIEARLTAIDPSLTEIFKAATLSMDQNNLSIADSLFAIVCLKAPAFDQAIRRLGMVRISERKNYG